MMMDMTSPPPRALSQPRRGALFLALLGLVFLFLGWLSLYQLGCNDEGGKGNAPASKEHTTTTAEAPGAPTAKPASATGDNAAAGPRPDILLVTFDTLRADHLGCYGYARQTSPNIDRFAKDGIRFEQVYAPMAVTLPSHLTLFTSILPPNHGIMRNGDVIDGKHYMMAERLKDVGYQTAAFVSSYVLRGDKFNVGQGFDHYSAEGKGDRQGHVVTNEAIAYLDGHADGADRPPLFVWVHYIDPHEPYDPPEATRYLFGPEKMEPYSKEQIIALYDGEIAYLDRQFGLLYDRFVKLSRPDGALVVATADHGEELFDHGWRGHGCHLYEESVHIPLIMAWPGRLKPGAVVAATTSIADVLPTLLGFLRLPFESDPRHFGLDFSETLIHAAGVSEPADRPFFFIRRHYDEKDSGTLQARPLDRFLPAEFIKDPKDARRRIYEDLPLKGGRFGVRVGPWKYQYAPDEPTVHELYDLSADPQEKKNLADERPEVVQKLSKLIEEWRKTHPVIIFKDFEEDVQKGLDVLGYVENADEEDSPPPKRNPAAQKADGSASGGNREKKPNAVAGEAPDVESGNGNLNDNSNGKKNKKAGNKKDGDSGGE